MSSMQRDYVLGFSFDLKTEHVVLIRKNKPEWQKGKWNGVGGKIERGETPIIAMRREFEEETGIKESEQGDWAEFALLDGPGFQVYVFRSWIPHTVLRSAYTRAGEVVAIWSMRELFDGIACVSNLKALIALALITDDPRSGSSLSRTILHYV